MTPEEEFYAKAKAMNVYGESASPNSTISKKKVLIVVGVSLVALALIGLLGYLVFSPPADASVVAAQEPDGFRGLIWGTSINDLPDMKFIEDDWDGFSQQYHRKNDKMVIGNEKANDIVYVFYRGRFSFVKIYTNEWSALQVALCQKYELSFEYGVTDEFSHRTDKWSAGYKHKIYVNSYSSKRLPRYVPSGDSLDTIIEIGFGPDRADRSARSDAQEKRKVEDAKKDLR